MITKVDGSDAQLKIAELPCEAKSVHVIRITLSPDAVGELSRKLKIITDLPKDNTVEIAIMGQAQ